MSAVSKKCFTELDYDELQEFNLETKGRQEARCSDEEQKETIISYLKGQKRLRAVTVAFSDLEGRFHTLDYDKNFLIDSHDNLTFDGSSVRGLSTVDNSDLRLDIDWGSFRILPQDIMGDGMVIVFGQINDQDGSPYISDIRGNLKKYTQRLYEQEKKVANVAVEIEGFLFAGRGAEQTYTSRTGFEFVNQGGYFNALPQDDLKLYIDHLANAKRTLGFKNEKDHPEVAPSQFELNYSYTDVLLAADQIQLYKLLARQLADLHGNTACFLPKPVAGINGNGMHTNMSISQDGKNTFYDAGGENNLSKSAHEFVDGILSCGEELCVLMNSSVNSYRRLDPNYEAPNKIKTSAVDRTSMVRVPLGNEKSARIEVRTVAPDANPYLLFTALLKAGLEGPRKGIKSSGKVEMLPDNIYGALDAFEGSSFLKEALGEVNHAKYAELKRAQANRCPKELGNIVKTEEILFHHEVTNQFIWSKF